MPLPRLKFARKWPHSIANWAPRTVQERMLNWIAGPNDPDILIHLPKLLKRKRKILIVTSEDFCRLLIDIPMLRSLRQYVGGPKFFLLCKEEHADFLRSIFPPEHVYPLNEDLFCWGDEHFKSITKSLKEVEPELVVVFRKQCPVLLERVLCGIKSRGMIWLYPSEHIQSGIHLAPGLQNNFLKHSQRISSIWKYAGQRLDSDWSILKPAKDTLIDAADWTRSIKPNKGEIWVALWNASEAEMIPELIKKMRIEAKNCNHPVKIVVAAHKTSLPEESQIKAIGKDLIWLPVSTWGWVLGLFHQVSLVAGFHNPLLYLASLSPCQVIAFLRQGQAAFDISFANQKVTTAFFDSSDNFHWPQKPATIPE